MLPSIYAPYIYIYVHTYVHEHAPLAKPGFCSGGRISRKPSNGALLSTSINKKYDSKSPNYCALLGTRTNINNDSIRIGASMDMIALPLAVLLQFMTDVTMIATISLIIIKKNNKTSKSNGNSNSNRTSSNHDNDHDSDTNSTSSRNSIKSSTSNKNEGSNSSAGSINPSTSTNNNYL